MSALGHILRRLVLPIALICAHLATSRAEAEQAPAPTPFFVGFEQPTPGGIFSHWDSPHDHGNSTHVDSSHGNSTNGNSTDVLDSNTHGNSTHGDSSHGNSTHGDSGHGDSTPGNSTHGDSSHGDGDITPGNSTNGDSGHGDSSHGDSGHGDSGHGDSGHGDSGHGDSGHGDSGHGDSGHGDSGHGDSGLGDSGHGDSGHGDSGHGDSSHGCQDISGHGDSSHGDSSHGDSSHGDSGHGDSSHGDSSHGSSSHGDSSHGDSSGHGESSHGDSSHGESTHGCQDSSHGSSGHGSGHGSHHGSGGEFHGGHHGHGHGGSREEILYKRAVTSTIMPTSAFLSLLGSSWIIIEVLRDRKKRRMCYHRLVFAMSCFDLAASISYFGSSQMTWVRSRGVRSRRCEVPGFFLYWGALAIPMYNTALATYFYLSVAAGWREDRTRRQFERYVQVLIPLVCLIIAIVPWPLEMYNRFHLYCFTTDNGTASNVFIYLFRVLVLVASFLVTAIMIFVFIKVKNTYKRSNRFSFVSQANSKFSSDTLQSSALAGGKKKQKVEENPMVKRVRTMAYLYTIPFYCTWTIPVLWQIIEHESSKNKVTISGFTVWVMQVWVALFLPLQGFLNWFIYMFPRFQKLLEENKSKNFCHRYCYAITHTLLGILKSRREKKRKRRSEVPTSTAGSTTDFSAPIDEGNEEDDDNESMLGDFGKDDPKEADERNGDGRDNENMEAGTKPDVLHLGKSHEVSKEMTDEFGISHRMGDEFDNEEEEIAGSNSDNHDNENKIDGAAAEKV